MNDLKKTIMQALADASIDHDDLDLLSDKVEAAILSSFRVARRQECDLAARLDSLQQAVLDGQEDPDRLGRELRALGEQIAEAVENSLARGVSFEEMERLTQLERKLTYLRELLDRLIHTGKSANFRAPCRRRCLARHGTSI